MKILTSITFLSLLTCITKEDNWAITITHANAKSKLCHSLFLNKILQMNMKSDFIQPVKLVTNYYALQKFLVYVMFSTHNMGWSNNQTCVLVSYRFVYILFHGLNKITLVVPFLMFHINFGYLFPAMISFVDKIISINKIHCKCLEQINTKEWLLNIFLTTYANRN